MIAADIFVVEDTAQGVRIHAPQYSPPSETPKLNAWLMALLFGLALPLVTVAGLATFIVFAASAPEDNSAAHALGGIAFAIAILISSFSLVGPVWYHLAGVYLNERVIEVDSTEGVVRVAIRPLPPLLTPGPFALYWWAARAEPSQAHKAVSRTVCGPMLLWTKEDPAAERVLPKYMTVSHAICPATTACCPEPPTPLAVRSVFVRHAAQTGRFPEMWSVVAFMADGAHIVLVESAAEGCAKGVARELQRALAIEDEPKVVEVVGTGLAPSTA